ncbi:hypothetical protein GCM10020255_081850 [Rhodococcus baikonurensis]
MLPLTPIMEWLVERGRGDLSTIRSYSQSALIALPSDVSGPALERALQTILDRHDVLRARLDAATHQLEIREPGTVAASDVLRRTLSSTSGNEFVRAAEAAMEDASSRLDPEHGTMISAIWLDPVSANGNGPEAGRLLLVLHHLAVDGVSWRMIVPGLVTAYASAFEGDTPILPPGGTSIRRWATALAETAADRRDEVDLWSKMRTDEPLLGTRGLDPAVDVGATVDRISVDVPTSVTENIISTVPQHFGGSVNDGLLAALAIAVTAWRRSRGQRSGKCSSISKDTDVRRTLHRAPTSRARSAGSPPCSRCEST